MKSISRFRQQENRLLFFLLCILPVVSWSQSANNPDTRTLLPFEQTAVNDSLYPVIMPYNRLLDPAGTAVHYGEPMLENHSLDLAFLPGNRFIAVEDRYGIAVFNAETKTLVARYHFFGDKTYNSLASTFSGIKTIAWKGKQYIFWSATMRDGVTSFVMQATWTGTEIKDVSGIAFAPVAPAELALPNDLSLQVEHKDLYLYVVLNGNNKLVKIKWSDHSIVWESPSGVAPYGVTISGDHAYVSNWGGPLPAADAQETAGVPWGSAYTDPRTGATSKGSVSVYDLRSGKQVKELPTGLHPNAILHSADNRYIFVANGNSDNITVIDTRNIAVTDSVAVGLTGVPASLIGSTPNALATDSAGHTLYVANGMDNAIAVLDLRYDSIANSLHCQVKGFIPAEAYPGGILVGPGMLYVTNLEAIGSHVNSLSSPPGMRGIPQTQKGAYTAHRELASLSFIPIPSAEQLAAFTAKVQQLNLQWRQILTVQAPDLQAKPRPVPLRSGEPSVFKHVLYIIKENRTYDQVLGDLSNGNGDPSLCIFGDSVTPNQHRLIKDFSLLDNYYASGKSSAEGHQWTDAGMVTDYVEKSVRGWFRSYPHAQYDAMVYDREGFIWNLALDHGKSVRIYGEACTTQMSDTLTWTSIYQKYLHHEPLDCKNITTISRVRPILSQTYPGYDDSRINDQLRADAFIADLHQAAQANGDTWPQLMVMSLPNDHTTGMSPGYPTPRAMVADNDLALARIVEAVNASRFWDSTLILVTEDDSQDGWDHVSAYRTTAYVISPYSRLQKTVSTRYNQTSLLRTIEQVLGLPPMNRLDASAVPMFDCFAETADTAYRYHAVQNRIPLNEMNAHTGALKGKALHYAKLSLKERLNHVDEGDETIFNRILWFAAKGNLPYPGKEEEGE